jgi:multiple sugar transport system permease protein
MSNETHTPALENRSMSAVTDIQRKKNIKRVQLKYVKIGLLFLGPTVALLFLTTIYPLIYALYLSFRQFNLAKAFIPRVFVGLQNYIEVLSSERFYNSIWVTIKICAIAISVEFILGFALALLLTQKLRGMRVLRTLFMIPMMISPVVVGLIWLFFYYPGLGYLNYFLDFINIAPLQWLGDKNVALYSICIADIWEWTPFVMLGIAAGLHGLPTEPFEAAKIDGCSRFETLFHITIPMLKPTLITLFFIRMIDCFKIYDIIFVLTKGGPGTTTEAVSFYIYREGFTLWRMGLGAAASFFVLIMITMLCMFFIKTLSAEGEE